jgi:hypothetical protein
MRNRCLLIISLCLLVAAGLLAQESEAGNVGGGYGYTTVQFDSSTKTITVYAETDVDDDSYYSPAVDTAVSNKEGYLFTSGDSSSPCPGGTAASEGSDSDTVSITCTIDNAKANDVYSATSVHTAVVYISDRQEGYNDSNYYDTDGYSAFAALDLSSPYADFYDPAYVLEHTKSQRLPLGKTNDAASTGPPATACGDVRDKVIAEYTAPTSLTVFTQINCGDFSAASTWPDPYNFTFSELTPTQTTGAGQFAVIQDYLPNYLNSVFNALGSDPFINSGYRNPAKEASLAGGHRFYPDSRHMAGDAVDLDNYGNNQNIYLEFRTAGKDNDGCVEPVDPVHGPQTNYKDTHIDWRTEADPNGHFQGQLSCPRGW